MVDDGPMRSKSHRRKSGHVWATSSSREDMTWTYHDLTVNGVGFEEKDMEKIFLTILICFDLFICARSFGILLSPTSLSLMSCQCRVNVVSIVGRLASLRWFWGSHFMPVANPGAGYKKLRKNCPRNNGRSRCISKVRTGNKCSNMWEILKRICTMALWFVSIVSFLWCFSMVKRHDRHVFTSTSLLFSKHLSA